MVQLMPLPPHHLLRHIGLIFLMPAFQACPEKEAVKPVSVYLSTFSHKLLLQFFNSVILEVQNLFFVTLQML